MSLDRNRVKYVRTVLNFWAVIGEIGGIYGVLTGFFGLLASILTYNKSENVFARHLYTPS